MKAEGCREWRERIGALALGQLPEEERFAVEAHLEGCPACRAEAEALAAVAALLGRADPDRLEPAPAPPPGLGERIARRIAAERRAERRRRRRLTLRPGRGGAPPPRPPRCSSWSSAVGSERATPAETVAFRSLPHGACAQATLMPRPWGSEISVHVYGFRRGTRARCGCAAQTAREYPPGRSATSTRARATTPA